MNQEEKGKEEGRYQKRKIDLKGLGRRGEEVKKRRGEYSIR